MERRSHPEPTLARLPGLHDRFAAIVAEAAVVGAAREVVERAAAVSVMRKAEEFMLTSNPAATSAAQARWAFEHAGVRVGVKLEDYERIVDADAELLELERQVLEDATRHAGAPPIRHAALRGRP